eukprot:GEMP01040033.1.p1 GENE.GEMP01040033.1~~GEMP01040033.1.p1  ORF type:complete len:393 (+),score=63.61 GEMP01040033.1:54-1181(+)
MRRWLHIVVLLVRGDIDNIFPPVWVNNPVARHVSFPILADTPGISTLSGHEDSNLVLEYYIMTLPTVGKLYETSQNYRSYQTDPKNAPSPLELHMLPFLVTDPLHRMVYAPPSNIFPPAHRWASFKYKVREPSSDVWSEYGICVINNPNNYVASSSFVSDHDGWTIQGNLDIRTPTHQPYGWGTLNRYISCQDDVQYIDFETGTEKSKWYFVAPEAFSGEDMVAAYGGTLRFTTKSTFGDFDYLNDPLDWVVLECETCNNGDGIRIVRTTDGSLSWDGSEQTVSIVVALGHMWMRDPLNRAKQFTEATACEIVATLYGLSRIKILGDWTQAGEGVALDNVHIETNLVQPQVPVECQQGCICRHAAVKRMSCCGND